MMITQGLSLFLAAMICFALPAMAQDMPASDEAIADESVLDEDAPPSPEEIKEKIETVEENIEPVVIGLLLPLSGEWKELGENLRNAAELAVFEHGESFILLKSYNTEGYENKSLGAFEEAVADDAEVIVGPLFWEDVAMIHKTALRDGRPVLALSSNFDYAARNIFMMGYDIYEEVARIMDYAHEQGARRFAILAPDDEYARLAETVADVFAVENDVLVTRRLFYKGRINKVFDQINEFAGFDKRDALFGEMMARLDLSNKVKEDVPVVQQLRRTAIDVPFDAVVLPMGGQDLLAATAFLTFSQAFPPNILFLGTSIWEDETLYGDPSLRGGWFVSTPIGGRRRFERRYEETFGEIPTRIAGIVYDAVALSANLMKTGEMDVNRLTIERGFQGVNGFFRFNKKGFVERALAVYEITPYGPRIIAAPKRKLAYKGARGDSDE